MALRLHYKRINMKLSNKKLKNILELHKMWVAGNGGTRANLSGANLSYANLSKADLRYTNLSYADLSGANLSYANLSKANLSKADLSEADLSRANLSYADLSGANLRYANLSHADLNYADLSEANLSDADLNGIDLGKVKDINDNATEKQCETKNQLYKAAQIMTKIARSLAVSFGPSVDIEILQLRAEFYEALASLEQAVYVNKENNK
jgi:uncharacterized protein YjbI with pentapeptide repeats